MAIKLGMNPKEFRKHVKIVTLDGSQDAILVTFKHRTRQQFAQLIDERGAEDRALEKAKDEALKNSKPETAAAPIYEQLYLEATKFTAERVLQIASGWDLVEPFDVEHLMQLENEFPGSLQAISNLYQASVAEARVKN
ncbi:MAG: phage tail assembly chaperone [Pseudomonadota bacterium]